jgi:hypothetical protein
LLLFLYFSRQGKRIIIRCKLRNGHLLTRRPPRRVILLEVCSSVCASQLQCTAVVLCPLLSSLLTVLGSPQVHTRGATGRQYRVATRAPSINCSVEGIIQLLCTVTEKHKRRSIPQVK